LLLLERTQCAGRLLDFQFQFRRTARGFPHELNNQIAAMEGCERSLKFAGLVAAAVGLERRDERRHALLGCLLQGEIIDRPILTH